MGRHIIFRCPQTGLKVQHWLNEVAAAEPGQSYQSVECPSCTLAHFVNRRTGKLLGEREE